ncbi:L,D-transpeptidase family protein [Mucilaginibacter sp. BJC16-A38]|uniref:L,D-transpeptidase family protein n=1 Tax=Mucilaginibacter phenanthrenivorans TaxID=1234842 RepID=UPI002157AB80|nr:L,D-transpeptidase family protein [Mucilaginibacter phenanthrenivorans]MCR8560492.1 L,D-transpeptidase family protein [Mucilaginibacter phenanthrenivorans]
MIKFAPVRRIASPLLILAAILITFQSCKKKRDETATFFFKKTHNKVYQDYSPHAFAVVFKKVFSQERSKLKHADFIADYYRKNHYKPEIVMDHLFNNDLLTVSDYCFKADEHGLDPSIFDGERLRELVYNFNNKSKTKSIDEIYHDIAEIEISAANSLINYSNALEYGVVNPKLIYQRYFLTTKRPDSLGMLHVFHINNMQSYLDSIQPKDPQYKALQKALSEKYEAPGRSGEESKRILLVNLERLRWKNKPAEDKYVIVNIPDFFLNVIDSGKSVLKMKVCVGQGRNMDNANNLAAYNDTCKVDNPNEHETPLLNSVINYVEVNPVWNIPQSIASKEILKEAADDRFYLANKGINVYKNGKLVGNPEEIDWTKVTKDNSPFEFKQQPGEDNSLGKIKFLFKNRSNVYLHDTPAKSAFLRKMRAVSHGCVRLGDPKALALNLFGPGERYDEIVKDMDDNNPDPSDMNLPKKVPVYITYVTCWADETGALQFRNDVYGQDIVLYEHLQKFLHPATRVNTYGTN